MLLSATPDVILPDVPTGRKQNCFYLVDNTQNAQRKQGNRKDRFWDDCSAWDSKKSRNLCTTSVRSVIGNAGYSLKFVEERDGKYCIKRTSNEKVVWEPLHPQPDLESIVVLCSYYATLKASNSFHKRVTWLKDTPDVVLIEYVGTAPEVRMTHGHSQKTNDKKFVRMHPRIMDKMLVVLQHSTGKAKSGISEKRARR